MVTVGISEYALKTAGYALYHRELLRHNLTSVDLPASERNFLSTSGTGFCFGSLVPAVGSLYPNATVDLEMASTGPPDALISAKGVRIRASISTTFRARMSNGSLFYLLTADVSAIVGLTMTLGESALWGNLTGFVPSIVVTDSAVGPVANSALQTALKLAARWFVVPKLNGALQRGVSWSTFGKFKPVNHRLEAQSQFLQIHTDILYEPGAK